jgi:hypothetical protein
MVAGLKQFLGGDLCQLRELEEGLGLLGAGNVVPEVWIAHLFMRDPTQHARMGIVVKLRQPL